MRQEAVWLLLPLLLAAALVVGGAALKEPLVRDRGFRFALYGGCGLLFPVEIVRILVCCKPAAAYAGPGSRCGGSSWRRWERPGWCGACRHIDTQRKIKLA